MSVKEKKILPTHMRTPRVARLGRWREDAGHSMLRMKRNLTGSHDGSEQETNSVQASLYRSRVGSLFASSHDLFGSMKSR